MKLIIILFTLKMFSAFAGRAELYCFDSDGQKVSLLSIGQEFRDYQCFESIEDQKACFQGDIDSLVSMLERYTKWSIEDNPWVWIKDRWDPKESPVWFRYPKATENNLLRLNLYYGESYRQGKFIKKVFLKKCQE